MKIEKVIIQNYRNFKNFEIELHQFNVIIGENNIGKTNLLNAISLILTPDITYLQRRVLELEDINYQAVTDFRRQIIIEDNFESIKFPEVKIEISLSEFTEAQEAIVGDWLTGIWNEDIKKNKAKITYVFSKSRLKELKEWFEGTKKEILKMPKKENETIDQFVKRSIKWVDFPIKYYNHTIYGGDYSERRIDYYWLSLLKMEFLDALRDPKKNLLSGRTSSLLYKILMNKTENKISDLKEILQELSDKVRESELGNISKEIKDYLKKISIEGSNSEIDFNFTDIDTNELLKRISLIYGPEPISIERNGLGKNNLLYIALLLSQITKGNDEKNINEKKEVYYRLIAIEEPEAHIHPHLQIHLSRNIKDESNKEAQIIITSHSTHITSQLPLDNITVLYLDGNDQNIKSYYLKNLPPDSKEYMVKFLDATKSTMFFARKVILVEGIVEQILIPLFFNLKSGKTLEQQGISLVNVNGISFKHFLEVIKGGYFIKSVVYTDKDIGKKTENRSEVLKEEYKNFNQILVKTTEESTFEKDIIKYNKSSEGKKLLFKALSRTKRKNGPQLEKNTGENDIDIEIFFSEIEKYKAEFAIDLLEVLEDKDNVELAKEFNIPKCIEEGFDSILS